MSFTDFNKEHDMLPIQILQKKHITTLANTKLKKVSI